MKKILVIAQNEAKAADGEKLLAGSGLHLKKVFPGAKRIPRHFDAVVVYHNEVNEVNFIKDEIQRYNDAPIKAFIGKVAYPDAGNYKAKAFVHSDSNGLLGYLTQEYTQLEEVISKVFKSFDKDNSGFVDINELRDVSKELGRELDQSELEECMKDLDINKDNKISYDEFRKWWLSGRQGLSPWMRRLLALKLKSTKFFGTISGTLKDVIQETESKDVEISTNHLSININKVQHAGFTLFTKLLFLSPELTEEHHRIKALHKFEIPEQETPIIGSVTVEIKDNKIDEALSRVEKYIAEHGQKFAKHLSVVAEGHRLCIGIALPQFQGNQIIEPHKDIVDKVQEELKVDQNIEVTLRFATSPEEILAEGAEPFITQLLRGVSLDIKLNVWKKIADVLLKVIESGDLDSSLMPIFGGIAPAFLLKLTGQLDLEVDDYMQTKIQENPLIQPLLMEASQLIGATSSISSEEEYQELLEKMPPNLAEIVKIGNDHLGDEIDFSFVHPQLGLKGRITGKGLSHIVKNGSKFIKV